MIASTSRLARGCLGLCLTARPIDPVAHAASAMRAVPHTPLARSSPTTSWPHLAPPRFPLPPLPHLPPRHTAPWVCISANAAADTATKAQREAVILGGGRAAAAALSLNSVAPRSTAAAPRASHARGGAGAAVGQECACRVAWWMHGMVYQLQLAGKAPAVRRACGYGRVGGWVKLGGAGVGAGGRAGAWCWG